MPSLEKKTFDSPDRTAQPPGAEGRLVDLDGMTVGRYTYQPGWRWVESVAPIVGTERCQVEHYGFVLSGRLRVRHADGSETLAAPGDVYRIGPDHQGEVDGDEPFETIEFLPVPRAAATRGSALG
jgi:hypothetical protein